MREFKELRRQNGSIVRHIHGFFRYIANSVDKKCTGCRSPADPALDYQEGDHPDVIKWRPSNYYKNRGGPKVEDCNKCHTYEYATRHIEKTMFEMDIDGRKVRHAARHTTYETRENFVNKRDIKIPTRYCQLCEDAGKYQKSIEFWEMVIKDIDPQIERHVQLHRGFDELGLGWYHKDYVEYRKPKPVPVKEEKLSEFFEAEKPTITVD